MWNLKENGAVISVCPTSLLIADIFLKLGV
jgi:hypothetical protein